MSGRKATSTAAPARGGASAASKKKVDESKIEELFTQLTDPEDPESADWIEFEGISKLCELLGIDPVSDVRVLVLLWKLKIPVDKPGQIYRKDFVSGMVALNLENVAGLQAFLPSLDPGFLERQEFRDLYKFIFQFSREGTYKTLEKDMVVGLMPMILDKDRAPHLPYFLEFLQTACKEQRITLDQWESFLQFNNSINVDLSNFEDDGAWPLLIDEYVEWRKRQR